MSEDKKPKILIDGTWEDDCSICGSEMEYVGKGRYKCIEECANQNVNEDKKEDSDHA